MQNDKHAEWQEPLTGPGVAVNHGYDFGRVLRPLRRLFGRKTEDVPAEGTNTSMGTPPESSVLLAAKHRCERVEGKVWDDATAEEQQKYLDFSRGMISSGAMLTKAKYLAKINATAWDDYRPKSESSSSH